MLGLASRFGLTVVDEIAAQPAGSSDTLYFDGRYYLQDKADRDFAPVSAVLQQQIKEAPSTVYNSYTKAGHYLDHLSVYEWIERYVPGGHKSQLGRYLDSAYNQEYGLDTPLQSSLNFVYLLGFQPSGPWQIYGFSDERYSILGGNQRLPEAIAASLPGGSVITQSTLTSIRLARGGGYTLTFNTSAGLKTAEADVVILTLPFSVLRKLDYSSAGFDELKQVAIQELGYGTNTKLSLQFSKRYWNSMGSWGTGDGNIYTDLFFQNTWDSSRGLAGLTGVLTAYMGGSNGASFTGAASPYAVAATDAYVRKYAIEFLSQLENVWPGVSRFWNGLATLSTPWTDPNLFGSYACWLVGQYTKFAGYERVRQGNCYFAGEHCSINFQGFMEGGAEEAPAPRARSSRPMPRLSDRGRCVSLDMMEDEGRRFDWDGVGYAQDKVRVRIRHARGGALADADRGRDLGSSPDQRQRVAVGGRGLLRDSRRDEARAGRASRGGSGRDRLLARRQCDRHRLRTHADLRAGRDPFGEPLQHLGESDRRGERPRQGRGRDSGWS